MQKYADNAEGTLATAITTLAQTTVTLTGGHGARFPALGAEDYFVADLIDTSNNLEQVLVTARATDVLTVIRNIDGVGGHTYAPGDVVSLRWGLQAATRSQQESILAISASGTDNYASTLSPAPTGYNTNQIYAVKFANANASTAPTWNANSFGAKTIKKGNSAALVAGDISTNMVGLLWNNGTDMILINPNNPVAPVTPAFSTGDVKLTLKTTADTGWVLMNDTTIGDASSGATGRANADTSALFALLWTNTVNADCAVSSGRGGSAAADFAAHKTLALPKALGRSLAAYGSGSGLTARALANAIGEETHILSTNEMPSHSHLIADGASGSGGLQGTQAQTGASSLVDPTGTAGGGAAHNNMQPTVFLNVMIML
jgi:microcystin-dependent protein